MEELKKIITSEGLRVSGNGVIITELNKINKKLDEVIRLNDSRIAFLLAMIEKKIEAMMTPEQLEKSKRKY